MSENRDDTKTGEKRKLSTDVYLTLNIQTLCQEMVLVRAANSYGSFSSVVSDFEVCFCKIHSIMIHDYNFQDNDFDMVKRLGSGFFSDVFLVKCNGNSYVKKTAKCLSFENNSSLIF